MAYTTIRAYCLDQTLTVNSIPKLASGGEKEIRVDVTFDDMWEGYGKTAIFYRTENKVYHVVMKDDTCLIPREVMTQPGVLHFGVIGTDGATVRTSEVVALTVARGAITGMHPLEPLPDVYKQVLASYGEMGRELAAERARLDNIIANGGTSDDAELIDVRVSPDGVTYSTAGGAVRGQSNALRNAVQYAIDHGVDDEVVETELTPGYINNAGEMVNPNSTTMEVTTGLIRLEPDDILQLEARYNVPDGGSHWMAVSYYDADGNFVKRYADTKRVYHFNNTGEYAAIRFSCRTYGTPCVIITRRNLRALSDVILPAYHAHNYDYIPMVWHNGFYAFAGDVTVAEGSDSCEVHTDLIRVKPGEKYRLVSETQHDQTADEYHWAAIAMFSPAQTFLNRDRFFTVTEANDEKRYIIDGEFTIPSGVGYIAVTGRAYWWAKYNLMRIVEEAGAAVTPESDTVVRGVAHRGAAGYAPENTLAAYRVAKERGFRYVECDVRFTRDNVGVLHHDVEIDRTSNGTGAVTDKTLAELKALDFGSWFGVDYIGETIPTFEEFIALCRRLSLHPYIELKGGTQTQIESLFATVKDYNMERKVTWIGPKVSLGYITALDEGARVGIVVGSVNDGKIAEVTALRTGSNEVFLDSSTYTDAEIELCRANGVPLEVWTVNDEASILALPVYVSGVTSDYLHAGQVLLKSELEQ